MDAGTAPADAGAATGTARFGEPCRSRTDCASGLLCVGGSGVTPFCTRVCTDDCTCPRGYGCAARLSTGDTVCVPGANGCNTSGPTDSGTATVDAGGAQDVPASLPDVPAVTPTDVGAATADVVNVVKSDAGATAQDAGGPLPMIPLSTSTGSCGCSAPGVSSPRAASLALLAGLSVLLRRARRRTRG
jgi:hypothetical protein